MTLPELLHKLTDRSKKNAVLAATYYLLKYKSREFVTSSEIRESLVQAHYPKAAGMNVSDVLAKSAPWVECTGSTERLQLWRLTPSGEKHVLGIFGGVSEELEHDVEKLSAMIEQVRDQHAKEYLQEALRCLRTNCLRACVVFSWVGAIQVIRTWLMLKGCAQVTAAVRKHQQNSKAIATIDDLAHVKESILLLAAQDLAIFDKNEKDILENYCLDLRNKCGHPGKYWPGEKKVSALLEDLISVVFSKA